MTDAEQQVDPDAQRAPRLWQVYEGKGIPRDDWELPPAPPWRLFDGVDLGQVPRPFPGTKGVVVGHESTAEKRRLGRHRLAEQYRADSDETRLVNAAICLRRPLLVTGKPGTGKSALAYSIAFELGLGTVLSWPITSRSAVQDGLYRYDAIGRLQEVNLSQARVRPTEPATATAGEHAAEPDIGSFLQLGPLGTALLPRKVPRVLLIDEIDKSDIDLPNDLLTVFEEGEFTVPELARLPESQQTVAVMTADPGYREIVAAGHVRCHEFPIVVLTSNGERDFPPAFLRRCIRLDIKPPSPDKLARIVAAHLGEDSLTTSGDIVDMFLAAQDHHGNLSTDQLLNALHMASSGSRAADGELDRLMRDLMRPLNSDD